MIFSILLIYKFSSGFLVLRYQFRFSATPELNLFVYPLESPLAKRESVDQKKNRAKTQVISRSSYPRAKVPSANFAPIVDTPELVFGLVGPIGVDLDYIGKTLEDSLKSFEYEVVPVRVSQIMTELKSTETIDSSSVADEYNSKINYANSLREQYGAKDLLAALAIGAIRKLRSSAGAQTGKPKAWIVRQIKTPEEVRLFRRVYGRQFILVSIYGDPSKRAEHLVAKMKIRSSGTIDDKKAREEVASLIERDRKEDNEFGQNLSSAFHLGDVFVDATDREGAVNAIDRFLAALFGSNEITPTHDEYGMYLAKSASLRSADLSRQVGAAIFAPSGEVISLGSNEVPKAGGGTYWAGDDSDSRDFRQGYDPNEINKVEIFAEIISLLKADRFLSDSLNELPQAQDVVDRLLQADDGKRYRDARVMDLIEFGRIIHAEMSAICDAARNGNAIRGTSLYVTTFPCHLCAKHIVASGIKRVIYLEPYPKSYAKQLHSDSIEIEDRGDGSKVFFQPFMGISPYRYRDLFEKSRRKDAQGQAVKWKDGRRRPIIDFVAPAHIEAEAIVVAQLAQLIAGKESQKSKKVPSKR
jgi:cytidine deaminase